jgi:hypothetical protein
VRAGPQARARGSKVAAGQVAVVGLRVSLADDNAQLITARGLEEAVHAAS